eukprot:2561598-Prymnesium_polylepis.1
MNNPGGSLKDRIAIHMIEKAEKAGKIKPGDTLVDISSGSECRDGPQTRRERGGEGGGGGSRSCWPHPSGVLDV